MFTFNYPGLSTGCSPTQLNKYDYIKTKPFHLQDLGTEMLLYEFHIYMSAVVECTASVKL